MKNRILIIALASALLLFGLCGCMKNQPDHTADVDAPGQAVQTANISDTAPADTTGLLTREEAESIALEHAGFTADQVTYLRTEYEIDDGVPQYEVQFHQGRWEYDYEINAKTGDILSYDRDD